MNVKYFVLFLLVFACSKDDSNPKNNGQIPADMILIPESTFIYQKKDTLFLPAYYIDKYEITIAQYDTFLQATGHKRPVGWLIYLSDFPHSQPVRAVSLDDAKAYAAWVGKRIPTEPEWEKAARGTTGFLYPWGNEWIEGRANTLDLGNGGIIATVGFYIGDTSPYGLLDTYGNVREWTVSCGDEACNDNSQYFVKGNDAFTYFPRVDLIYRQYAAKSEYYDCLGFRCALDVK